MFPFPSIGVGAQGPQFISAVPLSIPAGGSAPLPLATMGARPGDIMVYARGGAQADLTNPGASAQVLYNSNDSVGTVGYVSLAVGDFGSPPTINDSSGLGALVQLLLYRGCNAATIKPFGNNGINQTLSISSGFIVDAQHKIAVAISFMRSANSPSIDDGFTRRASGFLFMADRANYDGSTVTVSDGVASVRALGFIELT